MGRFWAECALDRVETGGGALDVAPHNGIVLNGVVEPPIVQRAVAADSELQHEPRHHPEERAREVDVIFTSEIKQNHHQNPSSKKHGKHP